MCCRFWILLFLFYVLFRLFMLSLHLVVKQQYSVSRGNKKKYFIPD